MMTMADDLDPFGFGDPALTAEGVSPPVVVPDLEAEGQADEPVNPGTPRVHPKAYPCPECSNAFTRSTHLKRHMLNQHGIEVAKGVSLKDPAMAGRKPADKAPRIEVNLSPPRGGGKDKELQAVEERARQLATTMAAVVLLMGQAEDSADITRGAGAWSKSVAELAEHEEWLRKLALGGETSARAMAWLQFLIATGALAAPILARHELLPAGLGQLAGQMLATGADLPTDGSA
jgi:hypothetical protein